jgi:hypothetical protein
MKHLFLGKLIILLGVSFMSKMLLAQQGTHDRDQGIIRLDIWNKVKYLEATQLGYSNPLFIGGRNSSAPISWGAYPDNNQQHRYYFPGNTTSKISFHGWSGVLLFDFSDPDQPKNAEDVVQWKNRMSIDHNGTFILRSGVNSDPVFSVEDGQVKARKITVTAGAIPDYVFAKEYKLMPLVQLKNYIETNKHLPGIKSEAEFAKNQNQLDIGEMQLQLLQKIEELTLYILQQRNEIELLKTQLKQ